MCIHVNKKHGSTSCFPSVYLVTFYYRSTVELWYASYAALPPFQNFKIKSFVHHFCLISRHPLHLSRTANKYQVVVLIGFFWDRLRFINQKEWVGREWRNRNVNTSFCDVSIKARRMALNISCLGFYCAFSFVIISYTLAPHANAFKPN